MKDLLEELGTKDIQPCQSPAEITILTNNVILANSLPGNVIEIGVFQGATARMIYHYKDKDKKIFLCDTFDGFKDCNEETEPGLNAANEYYIQKSTIDFFKESHPIFVDSPDVCIVKGYFPETATEILKDEEFCFVHLDVDTYTSTKNCLEYIFPKMVPGGRILIHDYGSPHLPGVKEATNNYFANITGAKVTPLGTSQALVIKQGPPPGPKGLMRKQFVQSLKSILERDPKTSLLLGDIGVFAFRDELISLSNRVFNIGILEQSTIGVAAGMSKVGLIPFVHTIAPFLVERAYEQLKVDFGYQNLNGNFISVGASYDYAALGCTHHCPADVSVLSCIPNMQIVIPGTSAEFDKLITESYDNGSPTYFRLSESENTSTQDVKFGKGILVKKGSGATVICFGSMLSEVIAACRGVDVTILYYTTVLPFDTELLLQNFNSNLIVCEPFYKGSINHIISEIFQDKKYSIVNIGIPRKFLTNYGTKEEHDLALGFTSSDIRKTIKLCINS